jgi:hypothetical protein
MAEALHRSMHCSELKVLSGVGGLFPIEVREKFKEAAGHFISRQLS